MSIVYGEHEALSQTANPIRHTSRATEEIHITLRIGSNRQEIHNISSAQALFFTPRACPSRPPRIVHPNTAVQCPNKPLLFQILQGFIQLQPVLSVYDLLHVGIEPYLRKPVQQSLDIDRLGARGLFLGGGKFVRSGFKT